MTSTVDGLLEAVDEGNGVLSTTLALDEQTAACEPDVLHLGGARLMLLYMTQGKVCARFSDDLGRTWQPRVLLRTESGETISSGGTMSVKRLASGALMLLHRDTEPRAATDRVPTRFRVSRDEGLTWSDGCFINPPWEIFAVHNGSALVLRSGRILMPGMTWFRMNERHATDQVHFGMWDYQMCYTQVYYSDDEGQTWQRGQSQLNAFVDQGRRGLFPFEEPSVAELPDGELFMAARTNLGRLFESRSTDGGLTWLWPEPMTVASAYAPAAVRAIPGSDRLLLVWTQTSPWEQQHGLRRHRLSVALSDDRGRTWKHFRNLESLDDRAYIEPPPLAEATDNEGPFSQPEDRVRYPHAPGPLRCAYPAGVIVEDCAVVAYDYMLVDQLGGKLAHTGKVKVLPLRWIEQASP